MNASSRPFGILDTAIFLLACMNVGNLVLV